MDEDQKVPLEKRMAIYAWLIFASALLAIFIAVESNSAVWFAVAVLVLVSAMFGCSAAVIKAISDSERSR
ncbi:MAG: hypothetical protein ABJF89_02350 [Parasphingorhabdus sp.]|uniref:hypothetical protein n=1 Tax=Sphingomonadales TaxID=204457 RepID=UPI0032654241